MALKLMRDVMSDSRLSSSCLTDYYFPGVKFSEKKGHYLMTVT